jgi:hypothetical protein
MKLLCALCVLCGLGVQGFALDREAFTFINYNLTVQLEPEQQRIGVRGKITLRNDSNVSQKNATLQVSSSLSWRSIQLDSKPLEFISQSYTSDIDHTGVLSEAIVTLPQAISPHGTVELEIGYEGTIPLDTTRLMRIGVPQEQAKHTDWDQISSEFTAVRGIGYVTWYPVATEGANLSEGDSVFEVVGRWKARENSASMHFNLQYPTLPGDAPVPAMLCDGKELRVVTKGGSPQFPWMQCDIVPVGLTVPAFAIAYYDYLERLPISVFTLPNHKSEAEDYVAAVQKIAPFVFQWFGTPRTGIVLAELPDSSTLPFESGSLLWTSLAGADSKLMELTAVRQLTHASFTSPRPWISEGLSHFAQALYREEQDGRSAAFSFMKSHEQMMLAAEKEHAEDKTVAQNSLINTSVEELYRGKAMYVWWMLRDMVGEPSLKRVLATYNPEQDKEPAYMQHLIEAQSKRDLTEFFDDWVYHDKGLPDFRVATVFSSKNPKEGYLVTVTVENLGNAGAEVPVAVRYAEGEATARVEVHGKSKASVRVAIPTLPNYVTVNDGSVPESDVSNNVFKVEAVVPDNH